MSEDYSDDHDRGALEEETKGGYLKKIIPVIFVTILLSVGATLIYFILAAKILLTCCLYISILYIENRKH